MVNRFLSADRVVESLGARHGFTLGWETKVGEFGLVRTSATESLFDQVWVHTSGRRHEAVTAYAGTSVVWGRGTKGLVELELLRALATVNTRGYALVTSGPAAERWLQVLGDTVDEALTLLRGRKGAELLHSTAEARHGAALYDALIPSSCQDTESLRAWLAKHVAEDEKKQARQLSTTAGLAMTANDTEFIEFAALVIAGPGASIPGTPDLLRASPIATPHLAARVTVLADLIKQRCVTGTVYSHESSLGS